MSLLRQGIGSRVGMMKAATLILMATSLLSPAKEIEGTVWYDSKGRVAWVEGPAAAKPQPAPFIPRWVAYEERRDRALKGSGPRGRGVRHAGESALYFHGWGPWRKGTPSVCVPAFRGVILRVR